VVLLAGHSFISNCAAKGVDQRLIDHWVGHTIEEMCMRYRHLVPDVSKAALLSMFGGVSVWPIPFAANVVPQVTQNEVRRGGFRHAHLCGGAATKD
jgi:hypothetical protein